MPYDLLEHTADIGLTVEGKDLKEIFHEALLGAGEILKPKFKSKGKIKRIVKISSIDKTSLLVDFLNEALYIGQANKEWVKDVNFKDITNTSVEAELEMCQISEFGEDIKAVTYYRAGIRRNEKGNLETILIFDI